MRTRSLFVSSVMGVALLGLAGSASAAPTQITASATYSGVDPLAPVTLNVSCPTNPSYSHTLVVGGGFQAPHDFAVYENRAHGNPATSWQVSAFNMASDFRDITAYANCLYWNGNPTNPKVVTASATSTTTIAVGATASSTTAKCASGVIVSGGYLSSYNGDEVPVYIFNGNTSSTGASTGTWKVTGYNNTGIKQTVRAEVNCLTGWSSAKTSQARQQVSSEGIAQATCTGKGAVASGGGWSITSAHRNFPYQCVSFGPTDYTCDMDYASSSLAYAECLVAP